MSIEVMTHVLRNSKATGRAKLVLLGIANHQGDNGAWPSIKTLSTYANSSERSVQRDIQTLVELGELLVEVNAAPGQGRYKTNRYWVIMEGVTDSVGVTESAPRGDKNGTLGVTPVGVQNVIRNVKEPTRQTFSIDWKPEGEYLLSLQEKYPNADLMKEAEAMIDYYLGVGAEKKCKDMQARFRSWLRKADDFAKGSLSKKPETQNLRQIGERL
jgi:hypothetical protein